MKTRTLIMLTLALSLLLLLLVALGSALAAPQVSVALAPQAAGAGASWSSGWVNIAPSQVLHFDHDLGLPPEQLGVEMWFRDTDGHAGIHRIAYGGLEANGKYYGAYWFHLTANSIAVTRLLFDKLADQVLIRVWAVDPPEYDSGWIDMSTGNLHLDHNLGITATDLVASVWFSGTAKGIHHYGYGTLTVGKEEHGAYWMRLTDNSIEVYRRAADEDVEQVRVVISVPDPPAYDSLIALGDWQDIARGGVFTFTHNLNWDPNLLTVRMDCYDTASSGQGINHSYAGGNVYNDTIARGYHLQNLTANTVRVVRRKDDVSCDQARVRIWKRTPTIRPLFMPLVMQASATETELAYDDGTAESNQSYTTGNGFAVRFTPPAGGGKLLRGRFYFIAPVAPIAVHVWDTNHQDLIAPVPATPAGDGWFDVDLSAANLMVNDDFYLGFLYTQDTDPTLGVDTSSPDGRSYEVPWEVKNYDYMIRAVVAPNTP